MPLEHDQLSSVVSRLRSAGQRIDSLGDHNEANEIKSFCDRIEGKPTCYNGNGQLSLIEQPSERIKKWPSDYKDQFWAAYPRRVGKALAMRKLDAIKRSGQVDWIKIIRAVALYASATSSKEVQFIAHPATWLNQGRWDDEPEDNGGEASRNGYAALLEQQHGTHR